MRAVICTEYGPPSNLHEVDLPIPTPGPEDVQVRIKATGVGFATGLMIQGLYQVKPTLPFCPGGEFAGVVEAVGEACTDHQVGDRVFGSAPASLAEVACTNAERVFPIPEGMSDAIAASLYGNYQTAIHGLRDRGGLQPGETLLVLGASGGVGTAAIAVAKSMGAHVIAAASTEEKRGVAMSCGADACVDYSDADWRTDLKAIAPRGVDVVYDPVGGDVAEPAFRSIAPYGRFLVVGFAAGTIPKIALNLPLLKTAAIVGVNWGGLSEADPDANIELTKTLLAWIDDDSLTPAPVTERDASDFVQAFEDQLAGRVMGKLVLVR